MLSVDTGIRGMLRREANAKSFLEQSNDRRGKRKNKKGAQSPQASALPAISEQDQQALDEADKTTQYSPTKYLKESLRLHGKLMRSSIHGSRLGGNGDLYEEFVQANYD